MYDIEMGMQYARRTGNCRRMKWRATSSEASDTDKFIRGTATDVPAFGPVVSRTCKRYFKQPQGIVHKHNTCKCNISWATLNDSTGAVHDALFPVEVPDEHHGSPDLEHQFVWWKTRWEERVEELYGMVKCMALPTNFQHFLYCVRE
jgi:hypothetical protein